MEAAVINPFIISAINVLSKMAFTKCKAAKPYLKKDDIAVGDVSGVVGITGEKNGSISVTFDSKSILAIVSNMFGEKLIELDDDVEDAVGELTNMISGQARLELEKIDRVFQGSIPMVVAGPQHRIKHFTDGPKIAIPFKTPEGGKFIIEICFDT